MLQSISHKDRPFTGKQEKKKYKRQFENAKEKQKSKKAKGNALRISEIVKHPGPLGLPFIRADLSPF